MSSVSRKLRGRRAITAFALLGAFVTATITGAVNAPHAFGLESADAATNSTTAVERPAVQPLSAEQEQRRAQQATELYGSPDIKPLEERKTMALSMGDSEMSGEGAFDRSLYDPATDRAGNYCHRSTKAVGVTIDLEVDIKKNIACSGAQTFQFLSTKQGGTYWFGENQGDQLEVLARNTHIKYVYMFISANDSEGLSFGPRLTDCVESRIWIKGACWPRHTLDSQRAVGVVETNLTKALTAVKQTMAEAGYAPTDYRMIMGSYPSPINPNWNNRDPYACGGMLYDEDAYFARNKVVPMFADAVTRAAANAKVQLLDMRTIFDGHSPCTGVAWVTGLYNMGSIFNENDWRQSFHPNTNGHVAFNRCFSAAFQSDAMVQSCQVKAGEFWPTVTEGAHKLIEIKNVDKGLCLGTNDARTANSRRVESVPCLGSIMTSLVYDESDQTLHHANSYDKCIDVWGENLNPGGELSTFNCNGTNNQKFVFAEDGTIRPATAQHLCVDAGRWGQDNIFGAWVQLRNCNPADTKQVFKVEPTTNNLGELQLQNHPGLCLGGVGDKFLAHTAVTSRPCGTPWVSWIPTFAFSESYITNNDAGVCLDGSPVAGAIIKVVPCGYHDYQWRQLGQFSYDKDTGYIVNRENPDLVVSHWGDGKTMTFDRRGASPDQKFNLVQGGNIYKPGEGYNDWLPNSFKAR